MKLPSEAEVWESALGIAAGIILGAVLFAGCGVPRVPPSSVKLPPDGIAYGWVHMGPSGRLRVKEGSVDVQRRLEDARRDFWEQSFDPAMPSCVVAVSPEYFETPCPP